MLKKTALLSLALIISGCVSNQAVRTVQTGDSEKSCETLRMELAQNGAKFERAKDDSGVTGKNVGLALLFWPGIIVNEVRANKNQDSVDARISHLTSVYNDKCSNANAGRQESTGTADKLEDLKALLQKGLISEDEYETTRQQILLSL